MIKKKQLRVSQAREGLSGGQTRFMRAMHIEKEVYKDSNFLQHLTWHRPTEEQGTCRKTSGKALRDYKLARIGRVTK